VRLFPAPFVLFDFPSIYYVSHKIQRFTSVVFEKVVETIRLAISGAEVAIADEN
jgi:hypothetical protein